MLPATRADNLIGKKGKRFDKERRKTYDKERQIKLLMMINSGKGFYFGL